MILQYLGTAAAEGWPGLFCACPVCETARTRGGRNIRTRSQAILFADALHEGTPDQRLLIDLPPDTYHHVLAHNLRPEKVGHLLITHSHADHFQPDELLYRGKWYANPVPPFPLHVYGNETVQQRLVDIPLEQMEAGIEFHPVENGVPFTAGEFTVTPLPALHDRSERCLIYLIEHRGKRLLYGNDTGFFPEETWQTLANQKLDLVSLDCTNCDNKEGTNHMGLPDALEVEARLRAENCLRPTTKIVLHHFSHNGGVCYEEMAALAAPHGYDISYDGGAWTV